MSRLDVGVTETKLLLRVTEQVPVQPILSVEITFPSRGFCAVQPLHVFYINMANNCTVL